MVKDLARISRADLRIAVLLALSTLGLLTYTAADIGIVWDETIYIEAAESYVAWLGELLTRPGYALSRTGIQEYWAINHEHPAFNKLWAGLVWASSRRVFDYTTAHRLGDIILASALVAILYLMLAPVYGRGAGLASVGALLTMPRFFFHAHLATLDVSPAVAIVAISFFFWRTVDRPQLKWTLWLGVACGFAGSTKINAIAVLPILLVAWVTLFRRRLYVFARLALMGIVGFAVWILIWPWQYYDTLNRLTDYLGFMTYGRYKTDQLYLGYLFSPPPWHFSFAMTLMVLPLTLTALAAIGSLHVAIRDRREPLGWLFVLGAVIPPLIFATTKGQIFDNERHLMPVFPYIAALSGIGFSRMALGIRKLTQQAGRESWTPLMMSIFVVLVFTPHIAVSYRLYPHLLSYYSETIGGLSGARHLGMETTYWAETYKSTLPYLNEHAPLGAMVWVEAHDVMLYYQAQGLLRRDLRIASPSDAKSTYRGMHFYKDTIHNADLVVIQQRESGFDQDEREWLRDRIPVHSITYGQIPLVAIYARKSGGTNHSSM